MTSLAARAIENSCTDWQPENLDEPADFHAVSDGIEEGFVLAEIALVEVVLPPV
jgi:hypothetical protein